MKEKIEEALNKVRPSLQADGGPGPFSNAAAADGASAMGRAEDNLIP